MQASKQIYLSLQRSEVSQEISQRSWAIHEKRLPGNPRDTSILDTNGSGPNWWSCIKNWRKDGCTYPKERHIYKSSNSQQKAIYWWRKPHTSGNQIYEKRDKRKPMPSKEEFEVSFYSWPWLFAFIISKLDSVNSLLHGLLTFLIDRLQNVQNAAARIITRTTLSLS